MKRTNISILAVLLAGLALGACDKQPEPIADQLKALDETADTPPPDRNLDSAQAARGRAVYAQNCLQCHGAEGKGQAGDWRIRDAAGRFPPPPLDDSAHAWHHPTAVLVEVVREGSPGGQGNMPAWKDKLSEQEIQDVVTYIKSLWSEPVYQLWWKAEQQSLQN